MTHLSSSQKTAAIQGGFAQHAPVADRSAASDQAGTDDLVMSRSLLLRHLPHMNGADAKVYLGLCAQSRPDGTVQAAIIALAHAAGVSSRTVVDSLKRLDIAGLVKADSKVGGSTANTYRVFTRIDPEPDASDRPAESSVPEPETPPACEVQGTIAELVKSILGRVDGEAVQELRRRVADDGELLRGLTVIRQKGSTYENVGLLAAGLSHIAKPAR